MKRILRKAKTAAEKADYYCDFSGKKLGDSFAAQVEIWCGYPSNRDGIAYHLHLSDEALDELMAYLRTRLLPRRIRETGSYYLEGLAGQRVRGGPEDAMSKGQLLAIVRKQLD